METIAVKYAAYRLRQGRTVGSRSPEHIKRGFQLLRTLMKLHDALPNNMLRTEYSEDAGSIEYAKANEWRS